MNILPRLSVLLVAGMLLTGCETAPKVPYFASDSSDVKHPPNELFDAPIDGSTPSTAGVSEFPLNDPWAGNELRLRQQDRIKISVWGYPELNHIATIHGDGLVTFPLIGEVRASGKTIADVRYEVEEKLAANTAPVSAALRFGDVVTLFVWNHPELAFSAVVQPDNTVSLPLIGVLEIADRNLKSLNAEIRKRLTQYIRNPDAWLIPEVKARRVLQNPRVSILPIELSPRKVAILGEVAINGQQVMMAGMRVMDVLANAQPFDHAALSSVVIIRQANSEKPSYRKLDLAAYMRGESPSQNLYVQEDDLIIIPKTAIAKVGYFIDMFFARTKPVFDWYLSYRSAYRYEDIFRVSQQVNEAASAAFESSTVAPTVP